MPILKLGLGSIAEAAHIVVSAVQAGRKITEAASKPGEPTAGGPDLSIVKLEVNLGPQRRPRPPSLPQKQPQ